MEGLADSYYENDDDYESAHHYYTTFGRRRVSIEYLHAKRTENAKMYDSMFSTMYERTLTGSDSGYVLGQHSNEVTKGTPIFKESTALEERPAVKNVGVYEGDVSFFEKRRAKRARLAGYLSMCKKLSVC